MQKFFHSSIKHICILFAIALMFTFSGSFAQETLVVVVQGQGEVDLKKWQGKNYTSADSVMRLWLHNQISNELLAKGYLQYQVSESQDTFLIRTGNKFYWDQIEIDGVSVINNRNKEKPIDYLDFEKYLNKSLFNYQDAGYPFTSINFTSLTIDSLNRIRAQMKVDPGPKITIDTVSLLGDSSALIPSKLNQLLKIKVGSLYKQSRIDQVSANIQSIPFLDLSSDPYITFQNLEAKMYLPVRFVSTSKVDAFLGILPPTGSDSGPIWTGQVDLSLDNLLKRGHRTGILWQRTRPESQLMNTFLQLYNPFGVDFNIKTNFNLLKEDSTFLNINLATAIEIPISAPSSFSIQYQNQSSRRLSGTEGFQQAIGDFRSNWYGASYRYAQGQAFDALKSSYSIVLGTEFGVKNIFSDQNHSSMYQIRPQILGHINYPLQKRWVINSQFRSTMLLSDQIFYNEVDRLGGLKSLRGFNELTFFVSDYALSRNEVRLFFEERSYFLLALDQAIIYNGRLDRGLPTYLSPAGMGLGASIHTNSGDFQIVFATGIDWTQQLDFNPIKVHFGYFALF